MRTYVHYTQFKILNIIYIYIHKKFSIKIEKFSIKTKISLYNTHGDPFICHPSHNYHYFLLYNNTSHQTIRQQRLLIQKQTKNQVGIKCKRILRTQYKVYELLKNQKHIYA